MIDDATPPNDLLVVRPYGDGGGGPTVTVAVAAAAAVAAGECGVLTHDAADGERS